MEGGLRTNVAEPTARPEYFLLTDVSSCSQEDGAGVMHFNFALLNAQLKNDETRSRVRELMHRLINLLSDVKTDVLVRAEEKYNRTVCNNKDHYLTFKVKFYPQENNRNFTECTMDLLMAILQKLGIDWKMASGGTSAQQTYARYEEKWVDYIAVEEIKRGMTDRSFGTTHAEDQF